MRRELQDALDLARTLPPEELPALIGALAEVKATAQARLTSPRTEARPDELLSVEETARRMGVSKNYLYRAHRRLAFARRIGRALRFSASGLDAYLKRAR